VNQHSVTELNYFQLYTANSVTTTKKLKINITDTLGRKKKWNNLKCSIKITNRRKRLEDKNRNKEQGQ
jgi:hypothetical protein